MKLKKLEGNWSKLEGVDKLVLLAIIGILLLMTYSMIDQPIPRNKVQTHIDGELDMPTWVIAYNFKSTSYSAHNEIHVKIIAEPLANYTKTYPDRVNNVKTLQIHFTDAYVDKPTYENGRLLSHVMTLTDSGNNIFEGEEIIKFDSGGEKCVIVKEDQRLEKSHQTCANRDSLIEISDPERLLELRTDKALVFLSLVFSIGVVIQFRNWVVNVTKNNHDLVDKNETTNTKPNTFKPMNKQRKPKKSNPTKKPNEPTKQNTNPNINNDQKS